MKEPYSIWFVTFIFPAVRVHTHSVVPSFFTVTDTPQISFPTLNCSPIVVKSYPSQTTALLPESPTSREAAGILPATP